MTKLFKELADLAEIDRLIRDPDFTATQGKIADKLGCSDRTIRDRFTLLRELGAPIQIEGSWAGTGFTYANEWDLWQALRSSVEKIED